MKKKEVTIERLAQMVQRGFGEAHDELQEFREDTRKRFDGIENRLDTLEITFMRIEKEILRDHQHRIERLEAKMGV